MTSPAVPVPRSPWVRPTLVLALALGAAIAVTTPVPPGVRAVVLIAFATVGPGLALIGSVGIADPWREAALAIGASLAVDVLVFTIVAYGGVQSAVIGFAALVGISVVGALAQLASSRLRHGREEA